MSAEKIPIEPEPWTVDDFFALVEDGQKADLIDGVIYLASPDSLRNGDITGLLYVLMKGFVQAHNLGTVHAQRTAFVLSPTRAPEPDVAFVAKEHQDRLRDSRVVGAPDIAVEVVARESRERDHRDKKRLYEESGVGEYWVIDPIAQDAEFYRLRDGNYVLMPVKQNGIFRSEVLPGFWLDVGWLLADPLPKDMDCLNKILAGDPVD